MKNGLLKVVVIIAAFVLMGSSMNSMSASLMTQAKNGRISVTKVASAGICSVKNDLGIGKDASDINIDVEELQYKVSEAKEDTNNFVENCSENAKDLIDFNTILMVR